MLRSTFWWLPARAGTPLTWCYQPEVDFSTKLGSKEAAYYQSLIGMLRWIVELGWVNIYHEVQVLSSYMALPHKCHLSEVLHIFSYLDKHSNAAMIFDLTEWKPPQGEFAKEDWNHSIYGYEDVTKELPPDTPKPLGKSMRF